MNNLYTKITVLATVAMVALSACSPITATRGNLISDTKFQEVKPHSSNRAEISKIWGPPTTTSSFDGNTWYYIGETTKQRGVFAPEAVKRRMIRVKFDPADNDTIIEVSDLDINKAKDIALVERKTPTAGREFTILQQFVGNIGKYNTNNPSK